MLNNLFDYFEGADEKTDISKETILNECLQIFFSHPDPSKSIYDLLRYLGVSFHGSRVYIFEIDGAGIMSNTYEWCAPDVKPQMDILQRLLLSDIDYWVEIFERDGTVEIQDIEDIRMEYPTTYSLLKPQQIHSLVAGPIKENGVLKGFIGIDNPVPEAIPMLTQVFGELGKYMISQLKRQELYQHLNRISYRDLLTGAYNYNAMIEHSILADYCRSFAVIYCDINRLKEINDTQGHRVGNIMLQECYRLLKNALHTEWIYRVNGDEFVALYYDVTEETVENDLKTLHLMVMQSSTCEVSIGSAWSDQLPIDTEQMLNRADVMMYKEKERYYTNLNNGLQKLQYKSYFYRNCDSSDYQIKLRHFLASTYCDIQFLLTQLSSNNSTSYFFFGDMQKNLFFISENMQQEFGFENNIVTDFFNQWGQCIKKSDMLEKFQNDIDAMLEKKQESHDLRYQVMNIRGENIWVHSFGQIKWNEAGTKPLFFAGHMIRQDENFAVDELTNFPMESVLTHDLNCVWEKQQQYQAIGFSLHNIDKIDNSLSCGCSNSLIRSIARELENKLSRGITFYKLSSRGYLALTVCNSSEKVQEIVDSIRSIIDTCYQEHGVSLQYNCSFALMQYLPGECSSCDFIRNMKSLIDMAHEFPEQPYLENSVAQKIQEISNMETSLMEDVINDMQNFRIVVQPVVGTEDGRPLGGEILLRWRFHGKDVSPSVFIPIMESQHVINIVGRWVFQQAVHCCTRILTYAPDFYLTVNVSLQQLSDEGFVEFIQQILSQYGLDGKHIVLELTESCMDDQPEKLENFVKACSTMNIRTALDDFGSGYSSLRVLLRYPTSIVKLDRSLLVEMSSSYEKSAFITSLVYACHQFDKKVCMEGVETDFQYDLVKESGCDLIQGFYFYKPMEIDRVYQLMAELYGESDV